MLKGETLEELEKAISARLAQYAGKIGGFKLDKSFGANLQETLKRFNHFAETGVDEDFTAITPVEIRVAGGKTITQWVRSADEPVTFTVPLKQAPQKVTLDPHHAVLRK